MSLLGVGGTLSLVRRCQFLVERLVHEVRGFATTMLGASRELIRGALAVFSIEVWFINEFTLQLAQFRFLPLLLHNLFVELLDFIQLLHGVF